MQLATISLEDISSPIATISTDIKHNIMFDQLMVQAMRCVTSILHPTAMMPRMCD